MRDVAVPGDRSGRQRRVLLVLFSGNFGGSTISGHLTARGLLAAGWQVTVAFGSEGTYFQEIANEGFDIELVPHRNWFRRGSVPQAVRDLGRLSLATGRFVRLIRRLRPEVVYVNSLASVPALIAARLLGVPSVLHIRELFEDVGGELQYPIFGGRMGTRSLFRRLPDQIVVISESVRENCLAGITGIPAVAVPNAVADGYFEVAGTPADHRARLQLPVDSVLIGVPGTLRPVKGHPFLLDVAERVIAARPQVQFLITGDGTPAYRQQLQEQASRQKLEHHVRFLGTIPDMRSFYRACDLICVPSRSESFGRTVIEAFAAGCPVVGSQVGGICETIDQGNTGVLVPYGDVAGFAEAVIALIDSPARRDELAKRASARARSEFRSSVYQQRIAEIVEQVVERKRRW